MRLIRILVAFACLAAGIVVGALNPQPVRIDFGLADATTTLGVAILVALLSGVVAGGLAVIAGVVLPLRQRLRRSQGSRGPSAGTEGT